MLLGKAVHPYVHCLYRGVKGRVVGPRNLVHVSGSVDQNLWLPDCMLLGELKWLMNEQGPGTRR